MRVVGLLKTLATTEWGADTESLMYLYRMLIRYKLDYGAIMYGSAKKELLRKLDIIENEAMRVATGAFRSSPVASLQIVTNEAPLQDGREQQALKYYYKIKENLKNPACIILIAPRQQLLYRNKELHHRFLIR